MTDKSDLINIGDGFYYGFTQFSADRDLNPQYRGIPDVDPCGILIWRRHTPDPDNQYDDGWHAVGGCYFDLPEVHRWLDVGKPAKKVVWQLHSLSPLHIEPSIQMYVYVNKQHVPSFHGFIRGDRWEWAGKPDDQTIAEWDSHR